MRLSVTASSLLVLLLVGLSVASDDQQKAKKLLDQITAMATDGTGKRAVNEAVSYAVAVPRTELTVRRRAENLSYGELLVASELQKSGTTIDDITSEIKSGKSIWQIADERHVNWSQLAIEAKRVNSRINSNLLNYFFKNRSYAPCEPVDGYDPCSDHALADTRVSPKDLADAQTRYSFLHDHAGVLPSASLDKATDNELRGRGPQHIAKREGQLTTSNTSSKSH